MSGNVVVVDPYSSGSALAGALRAAGMTAICVRSYPSPPPVYTKAFQRGDFEIILTAGADVTSLVRQLAPLEPSAVLAGAESGVLLADTLAAELVPSLANDPRLARARRHKGDMMAAIAAAGIPAIRTLCTSDPHEVAPWMAEHGLAGRDLVVKPVLSGGTEDVTLVPRGDGVEATIAGLLGKTNVLGLINDEVVVQERVTGTEYAVDTFTYEGRHTVTNVCRYGKVANGASFAVYERVEFLPYDAPDIADLTRYVGSALDALGVRFGLAHSEVMLTDNGPVLVESGIRPPGGGLPALTTLATGENGIDRLVGYLAGNRPVRFDFDLQWHVTSVFFIAPASGTISNTAAYQQLRTLPSCRRVQVTVRDGDQVPATTDLISSLSLGWVVMAHHDPDQVRRDCAAVREIERQVRIEASRDPTTPVPPPPGRSRM